jgi:hypothetical protein
MKHRTEHLRNKICASVMIRTCAASGIWLRRLWLVEGYRGRTIDLAHET